MNQHDRPPRYRRRLGPDAGETRPTTDGHSTLTSRRALYDNLNEIFIEWNPQNAEHYRNTVRPFKDRGCEELTDYDGLELLGWHPL